MSHIRSLCVVFCFMQAIAIYAQTAEQGSYELRAPASIEFNYDPFSGLPSSESFDVEIHNVVHSSAVDEALDDTQAEAGFADLNSQQEVILSIKPLNLGSFNLIGDSTQLPVELSAKNQPTVIRVGEAYEGRILLDAKNSLSGLLELSMAVPESMFAEAGAYTLELEVALFDSDTSEAIGNPIQISVVVSILQKLQTNIAGAKGRYDDGANFSVIDFGTLQSSEQRQVFIQVRGNTDADISVSSENKGRMINTENSNLSVNYTVEVDGELSELEVPLNLARSVAKDLQGSAYPMIVTIGNVRNSFAGVYQDIIHVDVSPQ